MRPQRPPATSRTLPTQAKPLREVKVEMDCTSESLSEVGRKRNLSPGRDDNMTVASVKTRRTSTSDANISPSDRLQGNCQKYMEILDLPQMLGTASWGNHLHQAQRVLKGLQNVDETSTECVTLQAHVTLAQECQKISAKNLAQLPKAEREKSLSFVMPNIVTKEVPATFRCALLSRIVRENQLSTEENLNDWLAAINPVQGAAINVALTCSLGFN